MNAHHNNNNKENADRLLLDIKRRKTIDTLIKANAITICAVNAKDDERSEKVSRWINDLNSLGTKKSTSNIEINESNGNQELDDLK
jgi:hypothetical protein